MTISVGVFASRESPVALTATLTAAAAASPQGARIDVLVNGNSSLAAAIAERLDQISTINRLVITVWDIPTGDKANAWNQHIHRISDGISSAIYIDGYVRPEKDAFLRLLAAMERAPDALGATGVPSVGRSAGSIHRSILTEGGFHGNLCAIRDTAIREFRTRGIRLPLGIYRTDATIGAILSFGINPADIPWNPRKYLAVDEGATWRNDIKQWWNYHEWLIAFKRISRQRRGKIENQAIRDHLAVHKLQPEQLPRTVSRLLQEWLARSPVEASKFIGSDILLRRALHALLQERTWNDVDSSPRKVISHAYS